MQTLTVTLDVNRKYINVYRTVIDIYSTYMYVHTW